MKKTALVSIICILFYSLEGQTLDKSLVTTEDYHIDNSISAFTTSDGNILFRKFDPNEIVCLNQNFEKLYVIKPSFKIKDWFLIKNDKSIIVYSFAHSKETTIEEYDTATGNLIKKENITTLNKIPIEESNVNYIYKFDGSNGLVKSPNEKFYLLREDIGKIKALQDHSKGIQIYLFDEKFSFIKSLNLPSKSKESTIELSLDDEGNIYRVTKNSNGILNFYKISKEGAETKITLDHQPLSKYEYSSRGILKIINHETFYATSYVSSTKKPQPVKLVILKLDFSKNTHELLTWVDFDRSLLLNEYEKIGVTDKHQLESVDEISDVYMYDIRLTESSSFCVLAQQNFTRYIKVRYGDSYIDEIQSFIKPLLSFEIKDSKILSFSASYLSAGRDIYPQKTSYEGIENILLKIQNTVVTVQLSNLSFTQQIRIKGDEKYKIEFALWLDKESVLVIGKNSDTKTTEFRKYIVDF